MYISEKKIINIALVF